MFCISFFQNNWIKFSLISLKPCFPNPSHFFIPHVALSWGTHIYAGEWLWDVITSHFNWKRWTRTHGSQTTTWINAVRRSRWAPVSINFRHHWDRWHLSCFPSPGAARQQQQPEEKKNTFICKSFLLKMEESPSQKQVLWTPSIRNRSSNNISLCKIFCRREKDTCSV